MALKPKVTYGSQVDDSDPAYPWGKARNVNTPGDGSGTPFEAALVNDIFGAQQALLSAAGITPSGVPDKVGASNYLDALLQLIANGLTAFKASANVWTSDNLFTLTLSATGVVNLLDQVNLWAGGEINYTAPKPRNLLIPLTDFVPIRGGGSTVWVPGFAGTPAEYLVWNVLSGGADNELFAQVRVPAGCTVTEVLLYTVAAAPSTLQMKVYRARHTVFFSPTAAPALTQLGTTQTQTDAAGVMTTGPVSQTFAEGDLLTIRLGVVANGNPCNLYWALVKYTETRATGSQ